MTNEELEIAEYHQYETCAEMAYRKFLKEERENYQLRQIGLAPSMVRKIDLSIPF